AAARSVIGLDWGNAIAKILPTCPVEDYERFRDIYWQWYVPHEKEVVLFPGMREFIMTLGQLGVHRAIATGKSRDGLNRVFALTGLEKEFESTQTASECLPKPNADMLEKIEIELGIPAEKTLMIGDTTHDVHMAHRFGCDVAAMTYGASPLADLEASEPTYICHTVEDLLSVLGLKVPA
ncbi:HAD-superfamily hydrolase, subfamily IA, variant 1, partial [gut metagenome]